MLLKSSLYYIGFYILFILVGFLIPSINTSYGYLITGYLLPALIAGFLITWKHQLEPTKSESWLFSSIMSFIVSAFSIILLILVIQTEAGQEVYAESLNQQDISIGALSTLAFGILFVVFLFCNRIGFGLGKMLGNSID